MGQLKITMAQFFRVKGGSTQNRGVVPDIKFPSAGDPEEYGERLLDHALPWTHIEPADYEPSGDLSQMVAVTDFRYQDRSANDREFGWLVTDIEEYNQSKDDKSVSLVESVRRAEMAESNAKRKAREEQRGSAGPLTGDHSLMTAQDRVESADTDEDEAEEKEDDRPDLLLRESARIVADMIELRSDERLAQQFSLLTEHDLNETVN
jgi:carboxyl-terminal processing protease